MTLKRTIVSVIALTCTGVTSFSAYAQFSKSQLAGHQNVITTAVPFLTISPDSRSAAMGDAGVALSPDANSIHWNPSKLAFIDPEKPAGFSVSYAPWLRQLVPDVSFSYISGYSLLGKRSAIGGSFRYFSLGSIQFTDINAQPQGQFEPNELALDIAYANKLSDKFSLGIALRFIRSNIMGVRQLGAVSTKPGLAGSGDVSGYYKDKKTISGRNFDYAFGFNISNIGSKITYTDNTQRDFIPINLRLGTAWTYHVDDHNSLTFLLDFNKLLVPTPDTTTGSDYRNKGVVEGMLGSFSDAPGGFKEELKEYNYSLGFEYWYDKQFAVRAGYFNEPPTKGNRRYFTVGIGIRYKVIGLDAAYLVPVQQRHPLQNQLRFSLLFDLDALKKAEEVKPVSN